MRFLIKTAFWLCLIVILLPIDRQEAGLPDGPGALETMVALQATVQDVRGFCDRNPQACATGSANLETLRQKAAHSVDLLQVWLSSDELQSALAPQSAGDLHTVSNDVSAIDHDALALFIDQVTQSTDP